MPVECYLLSLKMLKYFRTTTVILLCSLVAACSQPKIDSPNKQNAINISKNTPTPIPSPTSAKMDSEGLRSDIEKLITAEKETQQNLVVGVVIEDYTTDDTLEINADQTFDAASIGKLPILMLLYDQIAQGNVKESDIITINEGNVERYGTGSIQYQTLPKDYTIEELARLMIKVSDNTASSVLATKIGRNNLAAYVKAKGMLGTNTAENDTIPYDTMILLRELHSRSQKGDEYAVKMLSFMTDTIFEDRIPKLLPKEVKVAHKIGTQTGQFHDAGIVYISSRPFGIAVYIKNATNEVASKELIAQISLTAYQQMSTLNQK